MSADTPCIQQEKNGNGTGLALRSAALCYLLQSINAPAWDEVVLGRLHSWAGHLARIRNYDPNRLTLQVLDFKGMLELTTLMYMNGSQGHAARFHVWRWEAQFHKFYVDSGPTWQDAARGHRWEPTRARWIAHRKQPHLSSE